MDEVYQSLCMDSLELMLDFIVAYSLFTKLKHRQFARDFALQEFNCAFGDITIEDVYPQFINYALSTTIPEHSVYRYSLTIRCRDWWKNCHKTESKAMHIFKMFLKFNSIENRL